MLILDSFRKNDISMSDILIADLINHPQTLDRVVDWIDSYWSSFSGRTRQETHDRFAKDVTHNKLPISHIALCRTEPVGVATLRSRDSFDFLPGAKPWICNVYVDESVRGRGVAEKLCQSLLHKAKEMDFGEAFLATTMLENSLYHRMGFNEVHRVMAHKDLNTVLRKSIS